MMLTPVLIFKTIPGLGSNTIDSSENSGEAMVVHLKPNIERNFTRKRTYFRVKVKEESIALPEQIISSLTAIISQIKAATSKSNSTYS